MKNRERYAIPRNLTSLCPTIVKGEGIYLFDDEGRRYIDGSGGSSLVCSIGHGITEVAQTMGSQAAQIAYNPTHCSVSPPFLELGEKLAAWAPGNLTRVFFVSSGSEAVESAMKFARQYQLEKGIGGKHSVISRWQSYHGNTIGALSVSGHTYRRRKNAPVIRTSPHIPPAYCYRCYFDRVYPDCELKCARVLETAIRQEGPENVSAFIAEPVVGASLGAVAAPQGYYQIIREICDRYDVLFISDEVMTGFGRTGKNFAIEHWQVVPDFIATGKGMGGGYIPIGAVITSSDIFNFMQEHGTTFEGGHTHSGHLLSCRVAQTVLEYLEKNRLVSKSHEQGQYLLEGLQSLLDLKIVGDVRGKGLMAGVEFVKNKETKEPFDVMMQVSKRVMDAAMARGLIVFPGNGSVDGIMGDHILLGPALSIEREQIDEIVLSLQASIEIVEKHLDQ